MKHLKPFFETHTEELRTYFKDKINWEFYHFLEDSLIEYEDQGYKSYLNILIHSGNVFKNMCLYDNISGWTNDNPEFVLNRSKVDYDNNKGHIAYAVCMHKTEDEKNASQVSDILKSVMKKCKSKFDIYLTYVQDYGISRVLIYISFDENYELYNTDFEKLA